MKLSINIRLAGERLVPDKTIEVMGGETVGIATLTDTVRQLVERHLDVLADSFADDGMDRFRLDEDAHPRNGWLVEDDYSCGAIIQVRPIELIEGLQSLVFEWHIDETTGALKAVWA